MSLDTGELLGVPSLMGKLLSRLVAGKNWRKDQLVHKPKCTDLSPGKYYHYQHCLYPAVLIPKYEMGETPNLQ